MSIRAVVLALQAGNRFLGFKIFTNTGSGFTQRLYKDETLRKKIEIE
jgi:hypothetical protein